MIGFKHLAFDVPKLDPSIEALRGDGIEPDRVIDFNETIPGCRLAFFRDPEGSEFRIGNKWRITESVRGVARFPSPSPRWNEENKMPERTRRRSPDFLLHTVLAHLSEGCDLSALGSRRVVLCVTMVSCGLPHSRAASGYRRLANRPARLALSWPRSRLATLAEEA